jgi:hypothetical protein
MKTKLIMITVAILVIAASGLVFYQVDEYYPIRRSNQGD